MRISDIVYPFNPMTMPRITLGLSLPLSADKGVNAVRVKDAVASALGLPLLQHYPAKVGVRFADALGLSKVKVIVSSPVKMREIYGLEDTPCSPNVKVATLEIAKKMLEDGKHFKVSNYHFPKHTLRLVIQVRPGSNTFDWVAGNVGDGESLCTTRIPPYVDLNVLSISTAIERLLMLKEPGSMNVSDLPSYVEDVSLERQLVSLFSDRYRYLILDMLVYDKPNPWTDHHLMVYDAFLVVSDVELGLMV